MHCDYDPPEFYEVTWPKARKEYKCCECGYMIKRGEVHEKYSGKWDGDMGRFRTCGRCADLRDSLVEATCNCFTFGGLFEAYWEMLKEMEGTANAIKTYDRVWDLHLNWEGGRKP